jgi:hypothetical protein
VTSLFYQSAASRDAMALRHCHMRIFVSFDSGYPNPDILVCGSIYRWNLKHLKLQPRLERTGPGKQTSDYELHIHTCVEVLDSVAEKLSNS